ncbi:MAG: Mor transcription activator family protein [Pseudomonadota bacterium]
MIIENLPETIKEISEVIGLPKALAIVAVRGGEDFKIPKKVTPDHWLVDIVGIDSFKKLSDYYSGENICIPQCKNIAMLITDSQILADSEHMSHNLLARKYGLTRKGISNALERARLNNKNNK